MTEIHPSAIIDPAAEIDSDVSIGPWCIIESNVKIGTGTKLESCVRINKGSQIGQNNFIGHGSLIGGDPQVVGFDQSIPSGVKIGDNNTLRECVLIHRASKENENTIIGNSNYIMGQSHLGHDNQLEDDIVIVQGVVIGGHCYIEKNSFIGGLSAIHQFVRVGKYSMTAGCCKVVKDVPPFSTVDGNPATVIGINAVGLKRGGFNGPDRKSIKEAYKAIYHSALNTSQALSKIKSATNISSEVESIVAFFENSDRGVTRHR